MTKNIFTPFNNNINPFFSINFENVSLKLSNKYLFKNLSFKINTKGISAFIGPNATGKSSCIKLLIGLMKPNSGKIHFLANENNLIGYVPQKIILLRRNVEENLLHTLSLSNYPVDKRKERIKQVLRFLNLKHLSKKSARNLSAGHQQLVSIIRALIIRPNFLFLDEPCSNLDLKTIQIIEDLLKLASKSGVKIIIVTHDLFQAKRLSDEILFFFNGRIFEQNKTKNFFKNPKSKEAKDFRNGLLIK